MSDVRQAFDDIASHGTATVMIIRREEMPATVIAATEGNQDAQIRCHAVSVVTPGIMAGDHNCVFCGKQTMLGNLAALVFVAKEIQRGADALFTLVCDSCDEPDPQKLTQKILDRLRFKRLHHEAGHA